MKITGGHLFFGDLHSRTKLTMGMGAVQELAQGPA